MLDRRAALGAMGGGLALAAAAPAVRAATPGQKLGKTPALLSTSDGRLRAFILMRGALDDRLVTGCFTARYWGCVNGAMTTLFDVASVSFSRYRRVADGYESVSIEQTYFLDQTTGEVLETLLNPYTGKTVKVPNEGYPPSSVVFTPELDMKIAVPPPGMDLTHSTGPFIVRGDEVTVTESMKATVTSPKGGKPGHFHETTTHHARLGELIRPGVKKVRCEAHYTNVKSWRSWLEMGDHPGETISTGHGSFGVAPADFPKAWIAGARRHRPELLTDPGKLLLPLWNKA